MAFFRVRVRKILDVFIQVQADSQSGAEAAALQYDGAPSINVLAGAPVAGFPTYAIINTVSITDPTNALSKAYARRLADEAQESLDNVVKNLTSEISSDEFYLLREKIDELESTIEVILQ